MPPAAMIEPQRLATGADDTETARPRHVPARREAETATPRNDAALMDCHGCRSRRGQRRPDDAIDQQRERIATRSDHSATGPNMHATGSRRDHIAIGADHNPAEVAQVMRLPSNAPAPSDRTQRLERLPLVMIEPDRQRDRITTPPHRRRSCDATPTAGMIEPRRLDTMTTGKPRTATASDRPNVAQVEAIARQRDHIAIGADHDAQGPSNRPARLDTLPLRWIAAGTDHSPANVAQVKR